MKKGKERRELEEEWKEFFRDRGIKEGEEGKNRVRRNRRER